VVQRPTGCEAYRLLAAAVGEWNAHCPTMETLAADESELLDRLADVAPA
jgi:hypothetical protein